MQYSPEMDSDGHSNRDNDSAVDFGRTPFQRNPTRSPLHQRLEALTFALEPWQHGWEVFEANLAVLSWEPKNMWLLNPAIEFEAAKHSHGCWGNGENGIQVTDHRLQQKWWQK